MHHFTEHHSKVWDLDPLQVNTVYLYFNFMVHMSTNWKEKVEYRAQEVTMSAPFLLLIVIQDAIEALTGALNHNSD